MGLAEDDRDGGQGRTFKVGIDSYSLQPLNLSPFEILDWALINDAQGVQFSETPAGVDDPGFLRDLADYARHTRLYLEWGGGQHVPFDLSTGAVKDVVPVNRLAVEQAALLGARTVRSCSGGLMRWRDDLPSTETLLRETARSLAAQKSLFRDHGVILAVETHFEFTTWELRRLLEMCEAEPGDWLGICLDTMNLLTMIEDPAAATGRVLPWVVTTHIKDGGIALSDEGFVSFTAEAGKGIVDLAGIVAALETLPERVALSIEDHGGDFAIPIFNPHFLGKFPDLTVDELSALLQLARRTSTLMEKGRLAVLDRARWPRLCEERVKRDLAAVRALVSASPAPPDFGPN
jgi:sugar phosphate isomerase/epimerase